MSETHVSLPVRAFKINGGAFVPHCKNTSEAESTVMPAPDLLVFPMLQHIGAPCIPTVKKGDRVTVGQIIGDIKDPMSAPVHSGVSGTVQGINEFLLPDGKKCDAVFIENDRKNSLCADIAPPDCKDTASFLNALRQSGLVGLGGAGFPTHLKLNIPSDKSVDTLIVNCAECEPYITSDYREVTENADGIIEGIKAVTRFLNIKHVIIGVEDNKPGAIRLLKHAVKSESADNVTVLPLKTLYPQGAEKLLIYACTGRKIAPGRLPSDVGCIVLNVSTAAFIASYLKTGVPLITRRITVDGTAVRSPVNVTVHVGTRVRDLIEFCGGYKEPPGKLLIGGPMTGIALYNDSFPVLKRVGAVLAMSEKDDSDYAPSACIRCGRCVSACPMGINPVAVQNAVKLNDTATVKRLGVSLCLECGCCAYSCPARRYIVQDMRTAKKMQIKTKNAPDKEVL